MLNYLRQFRTRSYLSNRSSMLMHDSGFGQALPYADRKHRSIAPEETSGTQTPILFCSGLVRQKGTTYTRTRASEISKSPCARTEGPSLHLV